MDRGYFLKLARVLLINDYQALKGGALSLMEKRPQVIAKRTKVAELQELLPTQAVFLTDYQGISVAGMLNCVLKCHAWHQLSGS